ncbi:MAG: antitoxin [Gammaproteobacteria bacterium]|nr:antitoxin [Gammaproteobacteria bacterium]
MQTKLTLRMDDQLIAAAKKHATRTGKSLSQLVAEYFAACVGAVPRQAQETPTVARLRGCLKGTGVTADDYGAYLEEKYLDPTPRAR